MNFPASLMGFYEFYTALHQLVRVHEHLHQLAVSQGASRLGDMIVKMQVPRRHVSNVSRHDVSSLSQRNATLGLGGMRGRPKKLKALPHDVLLVAQACGQTLSMQWTRREELYLVAKIVRMNARSRC